jgi:hypothetical protein
MASRIVQLLLIIFCFSFTESQGQSASKIKGESPSDTELILIGNNTDLNAVKWQQVVAIFRGEKSFWPNGSVVVLVLPASNLESSKDVAKQVYSTSVAGMQKFWLSLVFQGRGKPPVFIASEEEIIKFVSQTPGAVALISPELKSKAGNLIIKTAIK